MHSSTGHQEDHGPRRSRSPFTLPSAGRPHPAPRPPAAGAVALQRVRRLRVRRLLRLAHPHRLHGVLGADGRAARAPPDGAAARLRGVARPAPPRRPRGHRAAGGRPPCARAACTATSTACGARTAPTSTCATVAWCSGTRTARSSHMVGAIRDITTRLEAERALHEAAELYRTLFENAVNPAYQIADDGRFLDANAAGVRFLETSRAQLLRRGVGAPCGARRPRRRCARRRRRAPPPRSSSSSRSGGAVKALTVTLVPVPLPRRDDLLRPRHGHHRPPHPAHGAGGVGGVAAPSGRRPLGQQHGPARDPRAAQPRPGRARAHHHGQRRDRWSCRCSAAWRSRWPARRRPSTSTPPCGACARSSARWRRR